MGKGRPWKISKRRDMSLEFARTDRAASEVSPLRVVLPIGRGRVEADPGLEAGHRAEGVDHRHLSGAFCAR